MAASLAYTVGIAVYANTSNENVISSFSASSKSSGYSPLHRYISFFYVHFYTHKGGYVCIKVKCPISSATTTTTTTDS